MALGIGKVVSVGGPGPETPSPRHLVSEREGALREGSRVLHVSEAGLEEHPRLAVHLAVHAVALVT